MFLLQKQIEIGKLLISAAPRKFEWSPKRLVNDFYLEMLHLIFHLSIY